MTAPQAHVRLKWLGPGQGGRKTPIAGGLGRYTPTARFSGADSHFGVILEFGPSAGENPEEATLRLLNPHQPEFRRGMIRDAQLDIMEGAHKVADCLVVSVVLVEDEAAVR
jgi:hypothetical protein